MTNMGNAMQVIGDLGQGHTGAVGLEVTDGQAHQAGIHFLPDVGDDPVGNPGEAVGREEAEDAAQDEDPDNAQGDENGILETAAAGEAFIHGYWTSPDLTAVVRVALGRAITQQWFPGTGEVQVIGLDTPLERLLLQALQGGGGLEPGLADRLLAQTQEALARQEMLGAPPVLLVNHALRPLLSRFLRRSLNQLVVLSNMELSDNRHIRMTATIGGK